jgi:hypothetical protein
MILSKFRRTYGAEAPGKPPVADCREKFAIQASDSSVLEIYAGVFAKKCPNALFFGNTFHSGLNPVSDRTNMFGPARWFLNEKLSLLDEVIRTLIAEFVAPSGGSDLQ